MSRGCSLGPLLLALGLGGCADLTAPVREKDAAPAAAPAPSAAAPRPAPSAAGDRRRAPPSE